MNTLATDSIPHLLVVDDNATHLTALSQTLEDAGYRVTTAGVATEALSLLQRLKVDLVITDLKMPDMDGISLLRSAQEIDPHLVGIVMTGHGAIDTAIEAMKAGALDYILKPFKLSTIMPVLKRALEVHRLRVEVSELQQRVREHVLDLESANHELEAFSYSVSHDLRAPLRVINGLSTALVESFAPQLPDEAKQLLIRITSSAERMGLLIDYLLRFARLSRQQLNKRSVDVAALVQELLDEVHKEPDNARAKVEVMELAPATGDAILLRQVFENLLSNAFKFTSHTQQPLIKVGCDHKEGESIYFVRDNGAGFDMRYASGLFKVFHRLHSNAEFEGTGVGLSFVQRIIQRHGGRIWAEGEIGKGATFYFTLEEGIAAKNKETSSTTADSAPNA